MKLIKTIYNEFINIKQITSIRVFKTDTIKGVYSLLVRTNNDREYTIFESQDDTDVWNKFQELVASLDIELVN